MNRQILTLVVLLVAMFLPLVARVDEQPQMPLGLSVNDGRIAFLRRAIIPGDFVAAGGSQVNVLSNFPKQQKVLIFSSIEKIELKSKLWLGKVDYIGYDLEGRESIGDDVVRASKFAKANDVKLLIAPTARLTEMYGAQVAPYADVFVVQFMRYQHDPDLFLSKLRIVEEAIHGANSDIPLWVQVSTQKPLKSDPSLSPKEVAIEMYDAVNAADGLIDGVWIFWPYSGTAEEQEFGLEAIKLFVRMTR